MFIDYEHTGHPWFAQSLAQQRRQRLNSRIVYQVVYRINEQRNRASSQGNDQCMSPLHLANIVLVEERSQLHCDGGSIPGFLMIITGAPVDCAERRHVFPPHNVAMVRCPHDE
jgi:hypothetical protein